MSNLYEEIVDWLTDKTASRGGKAEYMRRAKANKAQWHKTLDHDTIVNASTFMEWLDNLGFTIVYPEEQVDAAPQLMQSLKNENESLRKLVVMLEAEIKRLEGAEHLKNKTQEYSQG